MKDNSLRTRCAKMMNHPKSDTNQGTYEKDTITGKKKLHNTHTIEWMSPPIMKTKGNRYKMRRQP